MIVMSSEIGEVEKFYSQLVGIVSLHLWWNIYEASEGIKTVVIGFHPDEHEMLVVKW